MALPRFPANLRRTWTGEEVQRWIDDNLQPELDRMSATCAHLNEEAVEVALDGVETNLRALMQGALRYFMLRRLARDDNYGECHIPFRWTCPTGRVPGHAPVDNAKYALDAELDKMIVRAKAEIAAEDAETEARH